MNFMLVFCQNLPHKSKAVINLLSLVSNEIKVLKFLKEIFQVLRLNAANQTTYSNDNRLILLEHF